ncbi:MAG: hypothetical protein ACTSVK_07280, partial [Promethearchaeota archaeon]
MNGFHSQGFTVSKYLLNLLFDGDLDSFNAFNSQLAANDVSPNMQLWTDAMVNKLDYHGIYFINERFNENYLSQIFYQGTRIGRKVKSHQIDELGNYILIINDRDSFDEGIILLRNYYYYDKDGNMRFVHQDMRSDTMYIQDIKSQNNFKLDRNSPDIYYSKQNNRKGKKELYGDFVRYLGHMYGKDALLSLYLEN